ncbi:FkbM family methyltransferase [Pseudochelatococcus sp. B33]
MALSSAKTYLATHLRRLLDVALQDKLARFEALNGQLESTAAEMARLLAVHEQRKQTDLNSAPFDADWTDCATPADIFWCFRLLLGRLPSAEEWQSHMTRSGANLADVVKSYLGSLEFSHRQLVEKSTLQDIQAASINGTTIYAPPRDPVIGKAVIEGQYEPEIVSLFQEYVKQGMNVVDIGANIGYFSIISADIVGSSGHVLAVEPNSENAKLLEISRRANGFEHLEIALMAASNRNGLLILNAGESNGTTATLSNNPDLLKNATLVPSIRLDDLIPRSRRIDFVKIDVEGAEKLALSGMIETLSLHKPIIVSEFSPLALPYFSGCTGEEYLGFLADLGYAISVVAPNGERISHNGDIEAIMSAFRARGSDHIDILAEPT